MHKKNVNMLSGPLIPSILSYAVPIILTSILQLTFNAADMIIIGQYCGSVSVAAVGATAAISNLIVNLFMGLSVGAGVAAAHAIGSKQDDQTHQTVHTAIPAAILCGVILTIVGVIFAEQFLTMMSTPESVLPLSTVYMRIYFTGMTFSMVYNFGASILRAAGDSKNPLIFLSIAGVINVALNVLFVTVLDMNVAGVALATVISQGFSAVATLIVLARRTDACKLELRRMKIYGRQLSKILQIGLPAGIQGCMFNLTNVLIQSSVNSFGEVFVTGNAAAGNIEGFFYATVSSFSQAAINFVGQNHGAHQYKRVKQVLWSCMGCAAVFGAGLGCIAYFFGSDLLGFYITDSAEAIAGGMVRITFACVPYFIYGLMEVSTGALRGIGSSVTPMLISVLGICGFRILWLSTVFRIPQYHVPETLFIAYPLSWTITFIIQLTAFMLVFKKYVRSAAAE